MAAIAAKLGTPLMPWQQQVADVGLELGENGLPAYREVIVTVPRQNGKTTLVLAWEVDRAVSWGRRQSIIYSAQTGADARQKMLTDQVPMLEQSPFAAAIQKIDRTNGRESVLFKGGSRLSVMASSESSGHGKTIGLGVIDEAFDDVDDRREQALLPAMLTVPDGQLLVASTKGTDGSIYLNRKIEVGRQAVMDDRDDSEVAYFEWSAPDGADIDDPAVWEACMPAFGLTITRAAVKHARDTMKEGDFRRAMLNQQTATDERVIPDDVWQAVCSLNVVPAGTLTFAFDCDQNRSAATIVVVGDGPAVELVDHRPGVGWVAERVVELAEKHGAQIAANGAGPAGALLAEVERRSGGRQIVDVSGGNWTKACAHLHDAIADRAVQVRQHRLFDEAVGAARRRPVGDAWVWARKDTQADLSALCAMTVGVWAARRPVQRREWFGAWA